MTLQKSSWNEVFGNSKVNKGFTLIEILSVMVILGILAVITIPVITNVIDDIKRDSFENSVHGIVESARQYYLNSKLSGEMLDEIMFTAKNGKFILDDKELSFSGSARISDASYVKINGVGQIAINITDGIYSAIKQYDEASILFTENQ